MELQYVVVMVGEGTERYVAGVNSENIKLSKRKINRRSQRQ